MAKCETCDGTGEGICANCEDYAADCACGDASDIQDCDACDGTGEAEPKEDSDDEPDDDDDEPDDDDSLETFSDDDLLFGDLRLLNALCSAQDEE